VLQSESRKRPGTPSIGLTPSPVLEALHTPTLTLFVKKPFLFWRKKFSKRKIGECLLLPKADIQRKNSANYKSTALDNTPKCYHYIILRCLLI